MKEMNLTESEIQGYEMVVEVLAKALDIIDRQYRIKYFLQRNLTLTILQKLKMHSMELHSKTILKS
jgi:hypothetical protein